MTQTDIGQPFTQTPEPPYYAVIFSFKTTGVDMDAYSEAAGALMERAKKIDGFYGEEAAKTDDMCITVSYWRDEEAITKWREDAKHTAIRKIGKEKWYEALRIRVAKVERAYGFDKR